jgi:cytosine/adenosine deaminase-related metal-dependent hydrolase
LTGTLIEGARVFSPGAVGPGSLADIAVSGQRITAVGAVPQEFLVTDRIDARGCVILPGLFNAHTHTGFSLMGGLARSLEADTMLRSPELLRSLGPNPDDAYWAAVLA